MQILAKHTRLLTPNNLTVKHLKVCISSPVAPYCPLLSPIVSYCLLLSYVVPCCPLVSSIVSYCVILSHIVSYCLLLSPIVSHCLLLSPIVSCCPLLAPIVSYCFLFYSSKRKWVKPQKARHENYGFLWLLLDHASQPSGVTKEMSWLYICLL